MDLGHVSPRHFSHAVAPECRDNHTLQHPPVTLGRALFHPECDMLLLEAFHEFLDRDGLPIGIPIGGGILTVLDGGDDRDRSFLPVHKSAQNSGRG